MSGQKRFSLEGGDSLIPLLHFMNQRASELGCKEVTIGMAHRGRLNVLINILGKSPAELFAEFEGTKDYGLTTGDVKYHLGYSADVDAAGGPLHLSLSFNPSHLEVISSVVIGSVRARQFRRRDSERREVMPIVIHGDAAVSGQGIVMEILNMSQTRGYSVGGTVHIVVNNQVGFTTSHPRDARSGVYCTDIAKMIDAPVFHVNGDDPEAVVYAALLAIDYRAKFGKDVFIDLICYRLHGHNEADEPSATQPLMYKTIRRHKTPWALYAERLQQQGVGTVDEAKQMFEDYRATLDRGESIVPLLTEGLSSQYLIHWSPYLKEQLSTYVGTGVKISKIKKLAEKLAVLPEGFVLQRQVATLVKTRAEMLKGKQPLDWGAAEILAYATILTEGHPIRFTGQDVRRGTFAHRHAVLHDQNSDEEYTPLMHLADDQAKFEIYDSLLSEVGVLGFEYGYAKTDPKNLVIWEAQFGDFANGAQVIIDQFISSGWQKWQRLCGLTMLLPHGYEGMGPEHSSARLERYLQLCAQDNLQVCQPTTPAQIFHLLRRQIIAPYRKPLVVFTPKSLLRHKLAVS